MARGSDERIDVERTTIAMIDDITSRVLFLTDSFDRSWICRLDYREESRISRETNDDKSATRIASVFSLCIVYMCRLSKIVYKEKKRIQLFRLVATRLDTAMPSLKDPRFLSLISL